MAETATKRPGRNEPCHCGSGKKYKHCCLAQDEEADRAARERQAAAAEPPTHPEHDSHVPVPPPSRPAGQPWKHAPQGPRGARRLNTPRKAG